VGCHGGSRSRDLKSPCVKAAPAIRQAFGLEAAQLALGHSSAQVTDAVYAERDGSKVAEIMRRVG